MPFKETDRCDIFNKTSKNERAKVSMPETNSGRGKQVRTHRLVPVVGKSSIYNISPIIRQRVQPCFSVCVSPPSVY